MLFTEVGRGASDAPSRELSGFGLNGACLHGVYISWEFHDLLIKQQSAMKFASGRTGVSFGRTERGFNRW